MPCTSELIAFLYKKHTFLELVAILQQVFAQEPPVYTKPTSIATSNMGSPQMQQESLLDRASPSQQRQSMPSQPVNNGSPALSNASPMLRWMGESTALYNMNQGLAVSSTNVMGVI